MGPRAARLERIVFDSTTEAVCARPPAGADRGPHMHEQREGAASRWPSSSPLTFTSPPFTHALCRLLLAVDACRCIALCDAATLRPTQCQDVPSIMSERYSSLPTRVLGRRSAHLLHYGCRYPAECGLRPSAEGQADCPRRSQGPRSLPDHLHIAYRIITEAPCRADHGFASQPDLAIETVRRKPLPRSEPRLGCGDGAVGLVWARATSNRVRTGLRCGQGRTGLQSLCLFYGSCRRSKIARAVRFSGNSTRTRRGL